MIQDKVELSEVLRALQTPNKNDIHTLLELSQVDGRRPSPGRRSLCVQNKNKCVAYLPSMKMRLKSINVIPISGGLCVTCRTFRFGESSNRISDIQSFNVRILLKILSSCQNIDMKKCHWSTDSPHMPARRKGLFQVLFEKEFHHTCIWLMFLPRREAISTKTRG